MNLKKIASAVSVHVVVLAIAGCASGPYKSRAAEENVRDQALEIARNQNTPEGHEYEAIDRDYRARNFDNVLKRTKVFIKSYPQSELLENVYNLRGLAFIATKQYKNALIVLRRTQEITKSDNLKNMTHYNLAYVHFELGELEQAGQALDTVQASSLERGDRVKLYILKAKIARLRQDYLGAAQASLSAVKNMSEQKTVSADDPILSFLDEVLEPINNISTLEKLLSEYDDSPAADRLLYKIGNFYFGNGEREKAKTYFQRIVNSFPASRHYASARDALRKVEFQGVVDPRRIGVVLTLSGKFGKFGYRTLQGIELALKIFQPSNDPHPISLVVMDDQGEVDRALTVMDDLYYKHHVTAIIGPLVSKLAEPMGKKAQELGIPLVALTQKEATGGDFVFNAALTPAMQIHELMRYATEKAGVKNFAVLSPAGKFGEEYVKSFWDEIEHTGSVVRGFETYPNDETDFRTYIDKLVGLSQTDARAREMEELRLLKAATPIKTRSKKFDRMFELKPIVDFQAVFIPDEPKALGQILPTFAYRDVEKVLFLGTNTWNSQELIARAGQFAEGSVFVDGFYSGTENPAAKQFIEEYRQTFGSEPSVLEALAYDAGHILASLLRSSEITSRTQMRDRIMGLRDFPGLSGKISYQNGRLTKHLNLLTIKGGKIEEIAFQ